MRVTILGVRKEKEREREERIRMKAMLEEENMTWDESNIFLSEMTFLTTNAVDCREDLPKRNGNIGDESGGGSGRTMNALRNERASKAEVAPMVDTWVFFCCCYGISL